MRSVVPWLTFRGLHTDRLAGFSADLRLTFRGLPAECLGVLPHDAASFSLPPASTNMGLSMLPQVVLSWAANGTSCPREGVLGDNAAGCFPISDLHENMDGTATAGWVLGRFGRAGGNRTTFLGFSLPILSAVDSAIWHSAAPVGGTQRHGVSRMLRSRRGCLRGPRTNGLGRGILAVMTWISPRCPEIMRHVPKG